MRIRKENIGAVLLVYLPVVLLAFEYQISVHFERSFIRIAYGIIILCLAALYVITTAKSKFLPMLFLLGLVASSIVIDDRAKAVASTLVFAFGYCVALKANYSLNNILAALFVVNGLVVVCQVLGVDAQFYKFQTYSENWTTFNSYIKGENNSIPLHQQRVSGIFPSTIYLSLFQILVFGQLVASRVRWGGVMRFFMGVIFAFIASTVSLMLLLLSMAFLLKRRKLVYFHLGFLVGVSLLFIFFRAIYVLNYDWGDRLTRYNTRFVDGGGHSALTASVTKFLCVIILLAVIVFISLILRKGRMKINLWAVFAFAIVCISPLIVHDIVTDIRYWFVVGTACAHLVCEALRKSLVGIEGPGDCSATERRGSGVRQLTERRLNSI